MGKMPEAQNFLIPPRKYFFHHFSEKIRLDVSSESSARQRIHMKYQALFSSKDKSKKLKCHLLQFLLAIKG